MGTVTIRGTLAAEPQVERFVGTLDGDTVEVRVPRRLGDQTSERVRDAASWLQTFTPSLAPRVHGVLAGEVTGWVTAPIDGASLRQIGALRLPLPAAAAVATAVADQLTELERLRDPQDHRRVRATVRGLGPDTLYLQRDGTLRLTGWELLGGSWRGREAETTDVAPVESTVVAPERRREGTGEETGAFDLALLLLRLLLGRSDVEALEADLIECGDAHAHADKLRPFLTRHLHGASAEVQALVTSMLAWEPTDRPRLGAVARTLGQAFGDRRALQDFAVTHAESLTPLPGRFHALIDTPLQVGAPPSPPEIQRRRVPKEALPQGIPAPKVAERLPGPPRPVARTNKVLDWANTTEWVPGEPRPKAATEDPLPLLDRGAPAVKELTTWRRPIGGKGPASKLPVFVAVIAALGVLLLLGSGVIAVVLLQGS